MNPVWFVFLCIALAGIIGLVATLLVVAGESDRRAEEATRGVKALADARAPAAARADAIAWRRAGGSMLTLVDSIRTRTPAG